MKKILGFFFLSVFVFILHGCKGDDPLLRSCGESCVEFGRYYSEEDGSARNIEWIVLDKEKDGTLLLMSKYILECLPYNAERKDVTWETSTLRQWLNSDFIKMAFTHEEQERLIETNLENNDAEGKLTSADLEYIKSWNYSEKTIKEMESILADEGNNGWHTLGGNDTLDKAWVLAVPDLATYNFNSRSLREADPLPILLKNIGDICMEENAECEKHGAEGNYSWWLRTPGCVQHAAAAVLYDGYIDDDGVNADDSSVGVRPVIKIKMKM